MHKSRAVRERLIELGLALSNPVATGATRGGAFESDAGDGARHFERPTSPATAPFLITCTSRLLAALPRAAQRRALPA